MEERQRDGEPEERLIQGEKVSGTTNQSSRWRYQEHCGEGCVEMAQARNSLDLLRTSDKMRTANLSPQTTCKMDTSVRNNHLVTLKTDQRHTGK